MKGFLLATVVVLAFVDNSATATEAAKPADRTVMSRELIERLKLQRGLRLSTSKPQSGDQMPAVSLDIKFKLNSAELTDEAKRQIKQLAEALTSEQLSKDDFRVEGHTDSSGRPDYNLNLSKRRAQAVKDYLVTSYGVPPNRLQAIGRGQAMPIDSSDPADPRNRRVQVVNLGE